MDREEMDDRTSAAVKSLDISREQREKKQLDGALHHEGPAAPETRPLHCPAVQRRAARRKEGWSAAFDELVNGGS